MLEEKRDGKNVVDGCGPDVVADGRLVFCLSRVLRALVPILLSLASTPRSRKLFSKSASDFKASREGREERWTSFRFSIHRCFKTAVPFFSASPTSRPLTNPVNKTSNHRPPRSPSTSRSTPRGKRETKSAARELRAASSSTTTATSTTTTPSTTRRSRPASCGARRSSARSAREATPRQ